MSVQPPNPHDAQAAIAVVILVVSVICARYWRTVLLVLVFAAVACAVWGTIVSVDAVTALLHIRR